MQLFVEHLTVIDSAYLHPEHGIVGESWIVDVILHGDLDPQSMVMDFGHVKKQLKAAIDNSVDHTLIVPAKNAALMLQQKAGETTLTFRFGDGDALTHGSPDSALTVLPVAEITDAALVAYLETYVMQFVPANVSRVEIALRHEQHDDAYYHYAHGLKKHDGNCQRIAHGHRSRIMVWKNGQRSTADERTIADNWQYAYIATNEDIVGTEGSHTRFAYTSDQGRFTLSYPTARCRFLSTDSTVECIAKHFAAQLKERDASATYRVRAYEGVHKGAIAAS